MFWWFFSLLVIVFGVHIFARLLTVELRLLVRRLEYRATTTLAIFLHIRSKYFIYFRFYLRAGYAHLP